MYNLTLEVRPHLFINPSTDVAFVAYVDTVYAGTAEKPEALQRKLREQYPDVVVRPSTLDSEPTMTWYVYRDGHWVSSHKPS